MSLLSPLRYEIKETIGTACLVQRDKTRHALFYSDFPLRNAQCALERLTNRGFVVETRGSFAHINPGDERLRAFYASLPRRRTDFDERQGMLFYVSTAELLMRHEAPLSAQPADALLKALALADSGDYNELAKFSQHALAEALRCNTAVPSAIAWLLNRTNQ